ncbi:L-threonylcarbamoyladenylate synthase [Nitrosomonas sp. Nm51]|uniref:L-threonylcarbamoyladenylate synthase n=1 Tax=Nitrosomonas sp. Nm51 TaxID=133720 RepID=UPI0008BF52A9|nr:L-threonylcarbamoyladenylate synthase [Nitrosomonas sp. Nm51]SER15827.1 L-threonylcarbamoyladenylate synthase [Nitrosomonas sp. Nm51]
MAPGNEKLNQKQLVQISAAARLIRQGGIIAFPTETVYGLGADATNTAAVQKVYDIKQRPTDHPLIVHIGHIAQLNYWAREIPGSARLLARHFWPGPLTLILKRSPHIPDCVTGGRDTVGIRLPAHPVALKLLDIIGPDKAIAAPSANLYGKLSPTTAAHVRTTLGNKIDLILDGGACSVGLESTIIGFDDDAVFLLRPGGVPVSAIESVLNMPVISHKNKIPAIPVPGALPSHYAPTTPLQLFHLSELVQTAKKLAAQNLHLAVITWSGIEPPQFNTPHIQHICMSQDPVLYGQHLYAVLHQYDQAGYDYILMETPSALPAWLAITDRLQRASHTHL